ncbi:hypothetical protein AeNC1_006004 [Aphanomyces euteiches]|nr:hypothetical protein AeNC1_006004 [Aphanomyces euteiches]
MHRGMKLIQTSRVVDAAVEAPPSDPTATPGIKCRCKSRRCPTCIKCVKCQCYCNGPPQRALRPVETTKSTNIRRTTDKSAESRQDASPKRQATRTSELEETQATTKTKDEAAPSPSTSSDTLSGAPATPKIPTRKCRCKARRCDTCATCTKCMCHCNSSPPRKRKLKEEAKQSSKNTKAAKPKVEALRHRGLRGHGDGKESEKNDDGAGIPKVETTSHSEKPPKEEKPEDDCLMDEETRKLDEELRTWLGKRSDEQEELTQLEKQIYELEGSYLRRSQHAGNIVKGYANANVFVTEMAKDEAMPVEPSAELEAKVNEQRLFSFSSTTSPAEPFKSTEAAMAKP